MTKPSPPGSRGVLGERTERVQWRFVPHSAAISRRWHVRCGTEAEPRCGVTIWARIVAFQNATASRRLSRGATELASYVRIVRECMDRLCRPIRVAGRYLVMTSEDSRGLQGSGFGLFTVPGRTRFLLVGCFGRLANRDDNLSCDLLMTIREDVQIPD